MAPNVSSPTSSSDPTPPGPGGASPPGGPASAGAQPGSGAAVDLTAFADRLGRDQVFGPLVERGGTTLLPVARIAAGGGGGRGSGGEATEGSGDGGGLGMVARPVGAFSITADGKVTWVPAVDVNRIVLGGQIALAAVLGVGLVAVRRRRVSRG